MGRGGRAARGGKGKGDKRGESIEEWNGVGQGRVKGGEGREWLERAGKGEGRVKGRGGLRGGLSGVELGRGM